MNRILKIDEVIKMTGMAKTSIYKYMDQGAFPRNVKIGKRAMGWKLSDIQKWIDNLS